MRLVRAFGVRLVIGAIVLVVMAVGWAVNSVMRYQARGDAKETVGWFYDDARYASFPAFVEGSEGYLTEQERGEGAGLEAAFGHFDRKDFANEFEGDGVLVPDTLSFKVDEISMQDNDGTTAHFLVAGKVLPMEMERGRTKYQFSDDTYEPFKHLVTATKQGGSWYIAQVEPRG
jgi:hypothetical protein